MHFIPSRSLSRRNPAPTIASAALGLALCGLALSVLPVALSAQTAGSAARLLPENFNARHDDTVVANLEASGFASVRHELSASELVAAAALAAEVPALRISRDEHSLLPTSIRSLVADGRLARAAGADGATAASEARAFLAAHKALFGLDDGDLAALVVRYVSNPPGGATIVKFDQYLDGIQLFDTELAVVMAPNLDIAGVAGRLVPQVESGRSALAQFRLGAPEAIRMAVADLTGRELAPEDFALLSNDEDGYASYALPADLAADAAARSGAPAAARFLGEPTRVRPVLYPLATGLILPAYYLELWVDGDPSGSGPVYSYVVAADGGAVLFRNNLTQTDSYNYRVYAQGSGDFRPWDGPTGTVGTPHPTGIPDGFQAPFVSAPMLAVESLLGPTRPWLPPASAVTTGNNTEAYLDLQTPDGFGAGDLRGATSSASTFDYQYDSSQNVNVAVNRQAAVTGMFYQVNWQHDVWYQHGFNEVAGNAQTDNFGLGGAQNDSIKSEGQDFSGTDNANMSTPADGGRPRMQMYFFTAGGLLNPTRDGSFDMLIVGHEIMHYMSNRLVGNASGLGNRQGGAMGEGWGDFNCILTTVQDSDDVFGTAYAIGGQTDQFAFGAGFVDNYYYSIRHFPYSSSKLKNPYTFKDIGPGITAYPGVPVNPGFANPLSSPNEVHNAGEKWAEMLWEGFVALARRHGVAAARDKITQYMIDGMKATPSSPLYTEARDGILTAALAVDAEDYRALQCSFARRGMGSNAVAPARTSTTLTGVVEDFFPFCDGFEDSGTSGWSQTVN